MTKILQITNYYYPHIGGIEQVAHDLAKVFAENDEIEQKIICFNEDAYDEKITCRRKETVTEYIDGIEVIRCGCITKMASQSISLSFPTQLKRVMDHFDPEIVIFHYPNPYEAAFFEGYLNRKFKLVLYWHLDITKQKLLKRVFHQQTLRLLKRANKVVATSPNYIIGSPYLSEFRQKCIVIPNCIDESRLKVTERADKLVKIIQMENKGKIICFAVGRHVEYKGYTYLIQASKYLDDRFCIYIGGSGQLSDSLKAEAADDSKITFLGRVSDEELVAWFSAMDIFCFPSITKNEAFGIALAEAMYFAKPAVTFTIPGSGVNYVCLDGVNGLEVANRDPEKYAEALKKFADDPMLRKDMGESGKKRVMENFMFNNLKINIHSILNNI